MRWLGWLTVGKHRADPPGVATAKEALARVEADASKVEAIREEHEGRIRRNDFAPKIAAALHLRHIR